MDVPRRASSSYFCPRWLLIHKIRAKASAVVHTGMFFGGFISSVDTKASFLYVPMPFTDSVDFLEFEGSVHSNYYDRAYLPFSSAGCTLHLAKVGLCCFFLSLVREGVLTIQSLVTKLLMTHSLFGLILYPPPQNSTFIYLPQPFPCLD